ncbi:peptide deformylase [Candidatus Poribacteria bacterium]|nr:peptide deformylase [Candidatus Poribacteria bacterium]
MDVLTVRLYGDPVLREKAKPIIFVTDEIRALAREMLVTMYREKGVGLAAPQVGVLKRLIVVDPEPSEGERQPVVLIDPVIVGSRGRIVDEEGCLSFPDVYADVARAVEVDVEHLDPEGESAILHADGWLARVIQHEIDHLDGVLFIDHLSRMQRQVLRTQLRKVTLSRPS